MRQPRSVNSEEAQVIILLAVGALFLVGLLVVVADTALVYMQRRDLQNTADAAAMAGVQELNRTAPSEAPAIAAANSWADKNISDLDAIEPVVSESYSKIRVTVRKNAGSLFTGLGFGNPEVSASAAAQLAVTSEGFGLILLDQAACPGLDLSSNARVTVEDGAIYVNSGCNTAMRLSSNARVIADKISSIGNWQTSSNSSFTPPPVHHTVPLPDPFAAVPTPPITGTNAPWPPQRLSGSGSAPSSCNNPSNEAKFDSGSWRFSPGRYNCRLLFDSNVVAEFLPGVYNFEGGFAVNSNARVTWGRGIYVTQRFGLRIDSNGRIDGPNGVLYYNTCPSTSPCTNASQIGEIRLSSNAAFNIAPVGTYEGVDYENIVIWQDRRSPRELSLNSNVNIVGGAVYAAKARLRMDSNASITAKLQVVVGSYSSNSNAVLNLDVMGLSTIDTLTYRLVE